MARIFFKTGWTSDTHDRRRVFHAANYFIAGAKTYRLTDRGNLPIVTGCGRWRRGVPVGVPRRDARPGRLGTEYGRTLRHAGRRNRRELGQN